MGHAELIREDTLDDLLRAVISVIRERGTRVNPTKGPNVEVRGVLLELTNPRARLSRSETKGTAFSCLGELLWYLSGSNKTDFITYYIGMYTKYDEDGAVFGGYGPRLFHLPAGNQLQNVAELLRKKPDSRRGVVQLFAADDITSDHKDVPCTCNLQFMIRDEKLCMVTTMRSNDAFLGLPHDIFCFTMIQELMARALEVEMGPYLHFAGSLHLYDDKEDEISSYLDEGWQPTNAAMPPMPLGDPWPAVHQILEAERIIRQGNELPADAIVGMDEYWQDVVRLLGIFRASKNGDKDSIKKFAAEMESDIYQPFIEKKIGL